MNKLMKILKNESVVSAAQMLGKALLTATLSALGVTWLSGYPALTPSTKSQSMTVTALGFPAITVVTTTSQAVTNSGDDEGENSQTTSADVKPDVDASIVP